MLFHNESITSDRVFSAQVRVLNRCKKQPPTLTTPETRDTVNRRSCLKSTIAAGAVPCLPRWRRKPLPQGPTK